jgi:hypothetical protein
MFGLRRKDTRKKVEVSLSFETQKRTQIQADLLSQSARIKAIIYQFRGKVK